MEASFAFAAAMNSCIVFQGLDGDVIMTFALDPIISADDRSLVAS